MMDAAFSPKNIWKRLDTTLFSAHFNQHLSFLLEDACSLLEAQQIDFSVLRPLSCIDRGRLHSLTHRFHHSEQKSALKDA